ncbi:hypothetical protein DFH06DRAFT_1137897 [Mycena polygramma]|nr:hypothetical protein DFH06DRAFT_1137897 [Mycena polygramma]
MLKRVAIWSRKRPRKPGGSTVPAPSASGGSRVSCFLRELTWTLVDADSSVPSVEPPRIDAFTLSAKAFLAACDAPVISVVKPVAALAVLGCEMAEAVRRAKGVEVDLRWQAQRVQDAVMERSLDLPSDHQARVHLEKHPNLAPMVNTHSRRTRSKDGALQVGKGITERSGSKTFAMHAQRGCIQKVVFIPTSLLTVLNRISNRGNPARQTPIAFFQWSKEAAGRLVSDAKRLRPGSTATFNQDQNLPDVKTLSQPNPSPALNSGMGSRNFQSPQSQKSFAQWSKCQPKLSSNGDDRWVSTGYNGLQARLSSRGVADTGAFWSLCLIGTGSMFLRNVLRTGPPPDNPVLKNIQDAPKVELSNGSSHPFL